MSCPLNDGTVQAPRPGFEPGTPRSKRGMIVRFTIGASSGRQGSRTLISVGRTALAERPGQPYPATFLERTNRTSDWTMSLGESGEWGSNPRSPASKAGGLPLSYPLSGPRGTCTLISGVRSRRRPVGPAAQNQESGVRGQAGVRDQHAAADSWISLRPGGNRTLVWPL